jgi:hypothetical protein
MYHHILIVNIELVIHPFHDRLHHYYFHFLDYYQLLHIYKISLRSSRRDKKTPNLDAYVEKEKERKVVLDDINALRRTA